MTRLTTKARKKLPASAFAIPPDRYPIHDISHARNALSRVAANGTPEERRKVARAVARRYGIGPAAKKNKATELANGHPPYQWKHGWIPLTPDAKAIKAKKKSGSAKDTPGPIAKPSAKTVRKAPAKPAVAVKAGPSRATSAQRQSMSAKRKSFETTDRKIRAEFDQVVWDHEMELENHEQDVLSWYVSDSEPVSDYLTTGEMEVDGIDQHVRDLSKVIQRSKTKRPMTVYRGLVLGPKDRFSSGDVVSDKRFASTSYDPAVARYFSNYSGKDPDLRSVVVEIDVPAGANALVVDHEKYELDYNQSELIFDTGQPIRILEVSDDGEYARAEVVIK